MQYMYLKIFKGKKTVQTNSVRKHVKTPACFGATSGYKFHLMCRDYEEKAFCVTLPPPNLYSAFIYHYASGLQIRRGKRDNLESVLLLKKICCDPSLEPPRRDSSNEGSQHMFSLRNKKTYFELSSIPPLNWSTVHFRRS